MTKSKCAALLRERQRLHGSVPNELINCVSDDQIINSYNCCGCCGLPLADPDELSAAISGSSTIDQFIGWIESLRIWHHLLDLGIPMEMIKKFLGLLENAIRAGIDVYEPKNHPMISRPFISWAKAQGYSEDLIRTALFEFGTPL